MLLPERRLHRVQLAVRGGQPLRRGHLAPSAWTASTVQDFTEAPSSSTVQAPHEVVSQPTFAARSPQISRR